MHKKHPFSGSRLGRQGGFTLIELMITVAIIGILAAVALPSYTRYVARANRSAVESFMMGVANKQEQYMLDSRTYATTLTALNLTLPTELNGKYVVTLAVDMTLTPPTYLITGTPQGTQATNDAKCGTVSVNNLGAKTKSGSASTVKECW